MGNAGIAGYNTWSDAETKKCGMCGIHCDGLEYAGGLNDTNSSKCYFHYHMSRSTQSYTVGGSLSGGAESGAAKLAAGLSGSVTVQEGTPLVKMFRVDGEHPLCVKCFSVRHSKRFRSAALSLKGKAEIINSDNRLVASTIGDYYWY